MDSLKLNSSSCSITTTKSKKEIDNNQQSGKEKGNIIPFMI